MVTPFIPGEKVRVYNYYIKNMYFPIDEEEDMVDKLCAILSQFEFSNTVKLWEARGVPFRTHLYVPEKHPVTNAVFHEREDEGHVYTYELK